MRSSVTEQEKDRAIRTLFGQVKPRVRPLIDEGLSHLKEGRPGRALRAFAAAAKRDPRCAAPHLFRALALQAQGSASQAEAAIATALRVDPDSPAARIGLEMAGGSAEPQAPPRPVLKAAAPPPAAPRRPLPADSAARLPHAGPDDASLLKARLAGHAGPVGAELARLNAALAKSPRSAHLHQVRCELEASHGLCASARVSLRKAAGLAPASAEVQRWAAGIAGSLGFFREALAHQERAARLSREAADWLALARLRLHNGDAAKAAAAARKALGLGGEDAGARLVLGACAVLRGRARAGLADLSRCLRREPKNAEALVWSAQARRDLGFPGRALRDLRKAAAAGDRSLAGRLLDMLARRALGRRVPRALHDEVFIRVPWYTLGETESGSAALPSPMLERVLRALAGCRVEASAFRKPDGFVQWEPRARTVRLQALLRYGDAGLVLREFDRMIAEDPKEPYLHASRGEACLWLGRFGEAERNILRAHALGPRLPWPPIGLCAVRAMKGDYAKASEWLEKSVGRASDEALRTWQAELLRRRGEPAAAAALLEKTTAEPPFRPSLWLNLALSYAALGRPDRQRALFRRLARHMESFLAAAAREARVPWRKLSDRISDAGATAVLNKALSLMKGNRSSWFYAFVPKSGRIETIRLRLRGIPAGRVPSGMRHHDWAFEDPPTKRGISGIIREPEQGGLAKEVGGA